MREPLSIPSLLTPEGDPLSEEQQKRINSAKELLKAATKLRKEEKHFQAAQSAGEAAEQFKVILGEEHYLSVSAHVVKQTMDDYAQAAAEAQRQLIAADRDLAKAEQFFEKGFFAEAESHAMRALAARERILGAKHADIIDSLRVVGASRLELQAFDKANDTLSQAVQLAERTYGRNHPKTATLLDRHGWMKVNQGRTIEAMALLTEAVKIFKKTIGDTQEMAEAVDNLGTAALIVGEVEDALRTKLRALVIREKVLGHKARDTAVSLSNLAWLYSRIGFVDDVIPLREEALKIFREVVGPEHTYTKMELTNLCKVYEDRGMTDKAIALYREQIARDEQQAEQIDVSAVQRCVGLGSMLILQGQMSEAHKYLDKALARSRELLKTTASQPAIGEMERIAEIYDRNRMFKLALALYGELRLLDEKQSTPSDGSVRRGEYLGNLLISMGKLKEASELLKKIVADAEKVYGKGERLTASAMLSYCDVLIRTGELEEAERVGAEVLRICESKLPDKDLATRTLATANTLLRMGRIYTKQKRFDVARFTIEDALKIFQKDGMDIFGLVECQVDLAECLIATNQREKAEQHVKGAIEDARKFATQSKSPYADAALAKALHSQIELGLVEGEAKRAAAAELKSLLIRMRDAEAMDAENERWLSDLESAGK